MRSASLPFVGAAAAMVASGAFVAEAKEDKLPRSRALEGEVLHPPQDAPEGWVPAAWDVPPDRLSIDPASDFHKPEILARGITVSLNGVVYEGTIAEYCVSEGWVKKISRDTRGRISKYPDGKVRLGQPLRGVVIATFKRPA